VVDFAAAGDEIKLIRTNAIMPSPRKIMPNPPRMVAKVRRARWRDVGTSVGS
jgi:hypothetical protein